MCHFDQTTLDLLWQILQFEPTMGAQALLQRRDILMEFYGNALVIYQCHQVTPSYTCHDYQVGNKCYKFLPVKLDDKIYYVIPGTSDLIDHSPIVDCAHQNPGIFWNGTGCYNLPGEAIVHTVPTNLQHLGHWKSLDFHTPAHYHDGLAGYEVAFQNFRHYGANTDEY